MTFRLAVVTDLHFGVRARFRGKLRKVSDAAPSLADKFVARMSDHVHPDLVLALGDLIEEESHDADRLRYGTCANLLRKVDAPLHFAAGNHDLVHQTKDELRRTWKYDGELFYSFDIAGHHVCVLHTIEHTLVDVRLPDDQLRWLQRDLAATKLPSIVAMHHSAADQNLTGNRWFEFAPHLALVHERQQLRRVIAESGKVAIVVNGHVHWNHVDVHDGIPYVTVQSLTENVNDDEPARPASAWGIFTLNDNGVCVECEGEQPIRFELHR